MRLRPGIAVMTLVAATSCSHPAPDPSQRSTKPTYDTRTGKLTQLIFDRNRNGVMDTWTDMDGPRPIRSRIDQDEDGKIDRWEYYSPDQKLEKIGSSRAHDGKEDAWSYLGPDGTVARIDVSLRRDGRVTRVEHYQRDVLVAAEEDGDDDGKMDKWETYDGDRLASVAFDTQHRGTPDRRLIYGPDGTARIEVDEKGDGRFEAQKIRK